jgi:hypothetical protein
MQCRLLIAPAFKATQLFVAAGLALASYAVVITTADALTITNRSTASHELTIDDGDNISALVLKPDETVKDLCPQGCMVKLSTGDTADFVGTEIVEFDDEGFIFKD